MKKILLLSFISLISFSSFAQSEGLIQYRKEREQRKKEALKYKNEYTGQDGILYKVGDTLTIQPKLAAYRGIYYGGLYSYSTQFRQKHGSEELYFVIQKFRKETLDDRLLVMALCKQVGKKGKYTIFIDKASLNCEIRDCESEQGFAIETKSDKYDLLAKIKKLYDNGVLTKEEYETEKKKILSKD